MDVSVVPHLKRKKKKKKEKKKCSLVGLRARFGYCSSQECNTFDRLGLLISCSLNVCIYAKERYSCETCQYNL